MLTKLIPVSIQLIGIDKSKIVSESAKRVQKDTISSIAFLILLSLLTIILSYFSLFQGVESKYVIIPQKWFKAFIDTVVYWSIGVFMLTVLMILKRTSVLFEYINK